MKSSDRRSIIEGHDLTYEYLHYDDDGNVDASYKALKGVSLDVKEGQFIAILGHNGSGKSTLARQLNALLVPSGGTLFVDGLDTREEKNVGAIRQAAGMVFQNPDNQIIASVVEEDVGFGPGGSDEGELGESPEGPEGCRNVGIPGKLPEQTLRRPEAACRDCGSDCDEAEMHRAG